LAWSFQEAAIKMGGQAFPGSPRAKFKCFDSEDG
jgi:hypothetical protein